MQRLNSTLLNNQWNTEEIEQEIKRERKRKTNDNENTTIQNIREINENAILPQGIKIIQNK